MNELEQLELEFTISRVLQLSAVIADHQGDASVRRSAVEALDDLMEGASKDMTVDVMLLLAWQVQGLGVLEGLGDE